MMNSEGFRRVTVSDSVLVVIICDLVTGSGHNQ